MSECVVIYSNKTSPYANKTSPYSPLCIQPLQEIDYEFMDGESFLFMDGDSFIFTTT